jgi:hypothetical protein
MAHKRNWSEYNRQLVNRGGFLLYIDPAVVKAWRVQSGRRGQPAFSLLVIEIALTLREAYGLSLRGAQGFLRDLIKVMNLALKEPDYTLLCKRAPEVTVRLRHWAGEPKCLVIDSTGLKIYGQGEWLRNRYRVSKHQKWMKFHIGLDPKTQQIVNVTPTEDKVIDAYALPSLLADVPASVELIIGDGAYDRGRKYLFGRGWQTLIPPRHDAILGKAPYQAERNEIVRFMMAHEDRREGRRLWKRQSGYHRRSLVETAFSRLKRQFGGRVTTRKPANQAAQLVMRCNVLNRMMALTNTK